MSGDFEAMREEMGQIMERMLLDIPEEKLRRLTEVQRPNVYGFSIKVSSDGKPEVREFGNIKSAKREKGFVHDEREPLIDVFKTDNEVMIMAEVPGADEKDIHITKTDGELEIIIDSEKRQYYKRLKLPADVDLAKMKKNYKNGVLELRFQL